MNKNEEQLLAFTSNTNIAAKALANLLFREIIENAHAKYNISQEDMMYMNKQAVNRAAMFLEEMHDPKFIQGLISTYALPVLYDWDNPEDTEEAERIKSLALEQYNIIISKGRFF